MSKRLALKHAEAAHDSRGIGLAHLELVLCYQKVGDHTIVREHLTEAAAALHAAGDRRHLAQVHSLSQKNQEDFIWSTRSAAAGGEWSRRARGRRRPGTRLTPPIWR